MEKGTVQIIYGSGGGKSSLALGRWIDAISKGKTAIIIQFLKGNLNADRLAVIDRLEQELQVVRFEQSVESFANLREEEKAKELMNIHNGLNYAKKVMTTGECDFLVLDEVLGLVDQNIVSVEELHKLLSAREESMSLVLTGTVLPEGLKQEADVITHLDEG